MGIPKHTKSVLAVIRQLIAAQLAEHQEQLITGLEGRKEGGQEEREDRRHKEGRLERTADTEKSYQNQEGE